MIKQRPIVQIEVKKLKLNPKNPRKNDAAVDTVVKSIEKFGFNVPLFCDSSLTVYCGNTRLKAARKLELETVPCIVADDLTNEEIREYALVDNKAGELSEWDTELLEAELDELDMQEWEFVDWNNRGGVDLEDNSYLQDLMEEELVNKKSEPTDFDTTFTFANSFKPAYDKYIEEHGKEELRQQIIKICEDNFNA